MTIVYPDLDPVALQIGPLAIRWYGIAYAATFLVGHQFILSLLRRPALWGVRAFRPLETKLDELMLYIVFGVIVGGRVGHVLFYQFDYYLANPMEALAIWKGGMSFHGGFLGTVAGILVFAKKHDFDKWLIGDLIAAASPIGVFFVRCANFVNAEIIGSPSDAPWAILFPGYDEPRHPAMLYEAALEGLLLFGVIAYGIVRLKMLSRPGLTAGVFLLGYGVARIFVEFFKFADHRMVTADLPITRGMLLSAPMAAAGLWLIVTRLRQGATTKKQSV